MLVDVTEELLVLAMRREEAADGRMIMVDSGSICVGKSEAAVMVAALRMKKTSAF
jgi:Mrp family chromosome partitioning ATPase